MATRHTKGVRESAAATLAWARPAYLAGHHLTFLRAWELVQWVCRDAFEEGRIAVPEPPLEIDELSDALLTLAGAPNAPPQVAFLAGEALEGWRTIATGMLDELRHPWSDRRFDWSVGFAPGMWQLAKLHSQTVEALAGTPHFARWFALGECVAEARDHWATISRQVAADIMRRLRWLEADGRYPFVSALTRALRDRSQAGTVAAGVPELIDPWCNRITAARVHSYLSDRLRHGGGGGGGLPLVVVRRSEIDFLGQRFHRSDLSRTAWAILTLFCSHPRRRFHRREIINKARLDCDPCDLPPHITRLRTELRPAVRRYLRGAEPRESANHCFIVGLRSHDGGYLLDLEKELVEVDTSCKGRRTRRAENSDVSLGRHTSAAVSS